MIIMFNMNTSISIEEKLLKEVRSLYAYNGYKSLSKLIEFLLTEWVKKVKQ